MDDEDDSAQLAALGFTAELPRNLSTLSLLGLAFVILSTWSVLASTLPLSLTLGCPSAVVWGLIIVGACNLCLAASLAEFLSAYPTAGGQYHYVAVISPKRLSTPLAWISGWLTTFGWISVTASAALMGSQLFLGQIYSRTTGEVAPPLAQFGLYLVFTLIALVINCLMTSKLPALNEVAWYWSILGFIAIPALGYIFSVQPLADASFVFGYFDNKTGWPDGIAWALGFLQAATALNGYDAVSHMIEEIPNPSRIGPRIMIGCVFLGIITGLIFLTLLLALSGGASNIDTIISSPAGPLMEILTYATGKPTLATLLVLFVLVGCLFATTIIMTATSRMVYAFARDGGFIGSEVLARVHPRLAIPLNALYLTAGATASFGIVFLISDVAFNAICSASVVALGLSYALPIAIHCIQGRDKLPPRPFVLPAKVGWCVNAVGILYVLVTAVLFLLPPMLPVTSSTMNYGSVALALVMASCWITWIYHGRAQYTAPTLSGYRPVPEEE